MLALTLYHRSSGSVRVPEITNDPPSRSFRIPEYDSNGHNSLLFALFEKVSLKYRLMGISSVVNVLVENVPSPLSPSSLEYEKDPVLSVSKVISTIDASARRERVTLFLEIFFQLIFSKYHSPLLFS